MNQISVFIFLCGLFVMSISRVSGQDQLIAKQYTIKKWEISVATNSNVSFRNWEDLPIPNPRSFNTFPNILSKVGYGLTTRLNYNLNDA
jgi:hypothetical protein